MWTIPVATNDRQAASLAERPAPIADGWRAVQAASLAAYRRELGRERAAEGKRLAKLAAAKLAATRRPANKPRRTPSVAFVPLRSVTPGQWLAPGWRVPFPAVAEPAGKAPDGLNPTFYVRDSVAIPPVAARRARLAAEAGAREARAATCRAAMAGALPPPSGWDVFVGDLWNKLTKMRRADEMAWSYGELLNVHANVPEVRGAVGQLFDRIVSAGFHMLHRPVAAAGARFVSFPPADKTPGPVRPTGEVVEYFIPGFGVVERVEGYYPAEAYGMSPLDWRAAREGGYYGKNGRALPGKRLCGEMDWRVVRGGDESPAGERGGTIPVLVRPVLHVPSNFHRPIIRVGYVRRVLRTRTRRPAEATPVQSPDPAAFVVKCPSNANRRPGDGKGHDRWAQPSGVGRRNKHKMMLRDIAVREGKRPNYYYYSPADRLKREERRAQRWWTWAMKCLDANGFGLEQRLRLCERYTLADFVAFIRGNGWDANIPVPR